MPRSSPSTMKDWHKVAVIAVVSALTLALHYGWNPFGGSHSHIIHAIHGRLCYIPILLAAGWFGLRGGVLGALGISLAVTPYIMLSNDLGIHELVAEYSEIVFYFSLGTLVGWLFDRQRRAERERTDAELRLAQAERLGILGRMVATVAHEIRNPLGSIRGSVEILADDISRDSPQREFVDIITLESKRLENIVNTYLEYGAPKPPQRDNSDLTSILRDSIRRFSTQMEHVAISSDIPANLVGRFDSEQVSRIMVNLLSNAAEATAKGGRICVSARTQGSVAIVDVSDTGPGVASELVGRLFQPFVTNKANGSGLGLALSREIAEAHGGQLEFVPIADGLTGACFRLTLPIDLPKEN